MKISIQKFKNESAGIFRPLFISLVEGASSGKMASVKAQIIVKVEEEKEVALSSVHVTSGSANDVRWICQCPVWTTFQENQPSFDVVKSASFDGKQKSFIYSTEKKRKNGNTSSESGIVLKVNASNKEYTPIRIRVDCKSMEGEAIFVKPLLSLDGNMKFIYSVVLFMDPENCRLQERVNAQKDMYRNTSWSGSLDMMLLMERRNRLLEICRKMEAQKLMWGADDSGSDDDVMKVPEM